jgi:filamentous hemagglutinin family protein
MNHGIYRLVFNVERNAWVAVAECVRGRGKKSARKRVAAVVLGVAASFAALDGAWAARPVAAQLPVPSAARPFVFAGSVNGGQPTTAMINGINTMTVTTQSRTLGLNFDSFDVGSDAAFVLKQPDALSRALFRIWDSNPSQIYGKVTANGQLYLINQNGILFGAGAQVNVGGLVASALGMSDTMMNRLLTSGLPSAAGDSLTFSYDGTVADFGNGTVVVETGASINTRDGGKVVLIAPKSVLNAGSIGVDGGGSGEAIMAAGGKVILTVPDDPNLRGILVETDSFTGKDSFGISTTLDGKVTNAATGNVSMGTDGVVTLAGLVVNQQGVVNATRAINLNGATMLVSGTTETDRLTINQRGSVAQIDWVSGFNVGPGKTVEFVQASGDVAYNHVFDPDKDLVDGSGNKLDNLSAGRSLIDGVLKASGQLVLVNELGITFGANARVSANNFVASALGMNPAIVSSGLLGQTNVRSRAFYLNRNYATFDSSDESLAAADKARALSDFRRATVNVENGAKIEMASGGYVVLAGGVVNQGGSISTPNGQTLLAAGADLYLKPGYSSALRGFTAEVNPLLVKDANKSGIDALVALSRGADANAVTNTGTISASFGDISLVGHRIVQAGTLYASTSATANGSINLKARDMALIDYAIDTATGDIADSSYFKISRDYGVDGVLAYDPMRAVVEPTDFIFGQQAGTVSFADGSRTEIAVDGSNGKTLTADQHFVASSITALAKEIVVGQADILAKGGNVRLGASSAFGETNAFAADAVIPEVDGSAQRGVGVFVAEGAKIDVSGTNAQKSVRDLFVEVELRGDNFADNTVQRNGVLRGQKAWVDIRDAVEIADVSSYFNNVGLTVDELAATGGKISLASSGNVIVKNGASLDVSGGVVDYAAGTVEESRLLAGRKSYRLNDAPVWAEYLSLTTASHNEVAYVEGKSAGTVEIRGNRLAVDGQLQAKTTVGTRQREIGDPTTTRSAIPLGGQLIVQDGGQHYTVANRDTASQTEKDAAFLQAQMVFVKGAANAAAGLTQGDAGPDRLELSETLVDAGFSRFSMSSDGRIDIPAEISLNLSAGGEFAAAGRQIHLAGDISAPGGSITLKTRDLSLSVPDAPNIFDGAYSNLVVAEGASLSTSGVWVNDFLDGELSTAPLALNGGKIVLSSAHDLDIRRGSSIAVDGGGLVNTKRSVKKGNAGVIALTSGTGFVEVGTVGGSSLFLDGTLSGMALGKGGSLSIASSQVVLGHAESIDTRTWSDARRIAEGRQGFAAPADVVDRGGFYHFIFSGNSGLTVEAGQVVKPDPLNWSLLAVGDYFKRPTGSAIASFAATQVLPEALRSGTTSISLTTTDIFSGRLTVAENAYVGASTKGGVTLEAAGQMTVLGTLETAGGTIKLGRAEMTSDLNAAVQNALIDAGKKQSESIYLGENAKLLAGGATVLDADTQLALDAGISAGQLLARQAYRGEVLAGGTVSIDSGLGYLIMRDGALIDVSGATGTLNAATATATGYTYAARALGSAGGTVSLAAHSGMFLDGNFKARGGKDALGGVFSLRFTADPVKMEANPWGVGIGQSQEIIDALTQGRALSVYQTAATDDKRARENHAELWPVSVSAAAYLAGTAELDAQTYNGKAALDVALLQDFGSWYLTSQSDIVFAGKVEATVNNHLSLNAANFRAADDTTDLKLTAATARIGNFRDGAGAAVAATTGLADASITARDIGLVGTFGWSGFADSSFTSSGALHFDSVENTVRNRTDGRLFNGQMTASGALTFSAARLSPSTYGDFRIDLLADPNGSIHITRPAGALADVSLSPYGRLEFSAKTINHEGTISAPLGEVVFSAPGGTVTLVAGSKTSVAADRNLLFGTTGESGSSWNYLGSEIEALPSKGIVIDAAVSKVQTGAELDLSAGGEALAWEFTAGPGGKNDVLKGSPTTFAIVPGWSGVSATDAELLAAYATSDDGSLPLLKVGDAVSLGANTLGLGGSYVLLPARYAVLPGAYLVTVKGGNDNVLAASERQPDGSWLVAGAFNALNADGSTTAYSQSHLTLELASSEVVANRAKYTLTTASSFFYDQAGVRLAGDAGHLSVVGRSSLEFDPSVVAKTVAEISAVDGRHRAAQGLALDLAAPKLYVSNLGNTPDGYSVVDPSKLKDVNIASLLLGGVRTETATGTQIDTISSSVVINNDGNSVGGTALSAGEVLATASETLTVAGKSKIDSAGDATGRDIALTGDGAFLRVAEGSQVKVSRSGVNRLLGDLTVESTAAVAGQSLVFDATRGNELAGMVSPGKRLADGSRDGGGAVSIGAGRINVVADNSAPTEGVTLKKTDLERFAGVDQMRLVSYSTLDLYGDATLGSATLNELVVSAAGIAGHGGDDSLANISARQVVFENANPEGAQFVAGAAFGSGKFKVDAGQITFGDNATEAMRKAGTSGFKMAGFDAVELKATGDVRFAGRGVTRVESGRVDANSQPVETKLDITAGRVTSTSGADHVLTATGDLSIQRHDNATTPTTAAGLGSKLELAGKNVTVSGHIDLAAGDLTLAGTQGVTLNSGALVSAAGAAVKFADTTAYASGGRITLKSTEGDVRINEGAIATVSADAGGGNAGTIRLLAENGTVDAAAKTLRGNASGGKTQGSLVVDAATVALDRLANAVVDPSGNRHLGESWDVRRRVGDLVLTEQIKAHQFQLSADAGNIGIFGTVDASGNKGGSIALYANRVSDVAGQNAVGGQVELHAGSVLKANATEVVSGGDGTAGEGGSVIIGVSATKAEDELATGINFSGAKDGQAAASIDVSTAAGSKASGGRVTFRAPRQDELGKLVDGNGAEIVDNNAMAALVTTRQGSASSDYLLVGVTNTNSLANGTVISFNAYAASKAEPTVTVGSNSKVPLVNADGTVLSANAIKAGQGVVAIFDNGVFKISTLGETDTGSANRYKVTPAIGPLTADDFQNPGYTVTFRPKSANTAASTLEITSADKKKTSIDLKSADGSVLKAGDLRTDRLVTAVYTIIDGNGEFRLVDDLPLASAPVVGSRMAKVNLDGNVQGAAGVALEAVRVTRKTGDFVLGTAEQDALLKTASEVSALKGTAFVETADPGRCLGTVFRVGEEIRSTGNLLVGNDWSFTGTSAAGTVGALTLRAEGDLLVSGTITDGFVRNGSANAGVSDIYRDARVGSGGDSWSFRLVAGADADQAAPLGTDTSATTGSLVLADNKLIRTGTGSIDIAAAKDIQLGDRAAIYTAGVSDTTELEGFTPAFVNNNYTAKGVYSAFLIGGGDVSLKAGGAIEVEKPDLASVYQGNPNEWMMRVGGNKNLQWWLRVASFQSGIAAFGGGDISLAAGGDISNAIVAIPTSGRVPTVDGEAQPDRALITGGGDLSVQAQGSIIGGMLYAETGKVTLTADAIKPYVIVTRNGNGDLVDNNFYTTVAIGNSSVDVVGRQDVELGNVYNPLWANTNWLYNGTYTTGAKATSGLVTVTGNYSVRLGTFGERSALDVVSLAGNVGLNAQDTVYGVMDSETHRLMPAQVKVAALNGDIGGSVVQVPGQSGQLDLLAQGTIGLSSSIQQLDLAERYLPSVRNPVLGNGLLGETGFVLLSALQSGAALEKHTGQNWHLNDTEPSRLVALTGDVVDRRLYRGADEAHLFNEAVLIEAGGDVENMSLDIQHNHADDVSVIKAGGDIRYDYQTVTDPKNLPTPVTDPLKGIQVGGGGSLRVQAKGTIDLADTQGIVTRGNLDNPYLPEGGAHILAIAGGVPDYQGLYRELASARSDLVNLIDPDKSYSAAELGRNAGLQAIHQKIIDGKAVSDAEVLDVFYAKLTEYGRAAQNRGDSSQYDKGRTLAAALFPDANVGKGDILLSMSQIKTEQEGNIQLLVPGGGTVVGVAAPSLSKAASDQGIFTINGGDILAYVADDFLVNQSRVFTLDGGNIMIWADRGNIDAGSGAKTVNSTPPPVLVVRNGQIVLDTANSVSGSGIGVLASRDDTPASDMDLFAPEGAIDAGDAGLRSTGNITLGARVILNASNIQAAGAVTGAPAAAATAAPVAAVTSPTNSENQALEDAAPAAGRRDGSGGMLTVEVLDGGPETVPDCSSGKVEDGKCKPRTTG